MTISNLPALLFLVPFLSALLAAVAGRFSAPWARRVALGGLLATAGLALMAVPRVLAGGVLRTELGGWPPPIGIELLLDPLSAFMAVMVSVVALVILVGSQGQVRQELPRQEALYYPTALLMISGLMGIGITADLFNLFVQIELASLSAYALVAAGGRGAPRAGLNYLVIGSFGASLYLIGTGFIYAATGSLNMADVALRLADADPQLVLVGGLLMVAGLGIKMALFPLHLWMPNAYSRGPSVSATLMAPLVTKVSAYALLRIMFWVFGRDGLTEERFLLDVIALGGAAAAVAGGVMALVQSDFRRLLAYSSIGQMGIVALGIGLANHDGVVGATLHIANDALMKAVLFLAAGTALLRFGVRNVDDLSTLRGRAPWTSAAIAVASLSLVGIPPLAGFFGKWYVLSGTLAAGRWWLTAALVLGSLASVGYVIRILERLFFGPKSEKDATREGDAPVLATGVVLAALIILVGVFNARLVATLIEPGLPALLP
ncbi:MAG TPA: proton-conducting transporter membrane subunit [Gemmatimonadales bacterium]|nr:proton-conducting transporter membrane subunit [Gemmatimonadales bacterium]